MKNEKLLTGIVGTAIVGLAAVAVKIVKKRKDVSEEAQITQIEDQDIK